MAAIRIPLHLRLPHADAPAAPRAGASLAAGVVAGTVTIALMQWVSIVAYDESPWKLPRMMAALVAGPGVLVDEDIPGAAVALGYAVHYTLSLLYALALGGVLGGLRREHPPIVGFLAGVALYAVNLHGFTAVFPWFAEMRTLDTLIAHAVFGVVAAGAYCEFSRPRRDPDID